MTIHDQIQQAEVRLRTLRERRAVGLLDSKLFKGGNEIVELEAQIEALRDAQTELHRRDRKSADHAAKVAVGVLSSEIAQAEIDRLEALDAAEVAFREAMVKIGEAQRLSALVNHKSTRLSRAKGIPKGGMSALSPVDVELRLSELMGASMRSIASTPGLFGGVSWFGDRVSPDTGWADSEHYTIRHQLAALIGDKHFKRIQQEQNND